jgi:hypothetical protein
MEQVAVMASDDGTAVTFRVVNDANRVTSIAVTTDLKLDDATVGQSPVLCACWFGVRSVDTVAVRVRELGTWGKNIRRPGAIRTDALADCDDIKYGGTRIIRRGCVCTCILVRGVQAWQDKLKNSNID